MHPLEEKIDCFGIQKVLYSFEHTEIQDLEFMEV